MTFAHPDNPSTARRYFLYCRKSLEAEDRQILSMDSQETELRTAFERRGDIQIVEIFKEAYSAKAPGRPVFEQMLARIERGDAEGIIAWHPDRLARNSIDGGRIIYLLDRQVLKDLKFATFSFENNSQGKFMLSIVFGYSKYYVDTLSENVKRGYRAKVALGWRPGPAPLGYRNDKETKTIVRDEANFETVQRIFRLALTNVYTVRSILRIVTDEWGYRPERWSRRGRLIACSTLYRMLGNPFYAGYFYWNGRLHQGKHEPMIALEEFQRLQELIGRPGTEKPQQHSFPYTGLMRCGACGLMVTAEHKVNRYGSRYVYYHCTKRGHGPRCPEPSVERAALERQLADFLATVTLDEELLLELSTATAEAGTGAPDANETAQKQIGQSLVALRRQIETLTDLRVREIIADDEFLARRRELEMSIAASEQRLQNVQSAEDWFEPATLLISFRKQALDWFVHGTDDIKRSIIKTIGSNLTLQAKKLRAEAKKPFRLQVVKGDISIKSSFGNHVRTWFESRDPEFMEAIRQIREITATVEAAAHREAPRPAEACAPGSRTGSKARSSGPSLRRRKAPRRDPLSSSHGSARLSGR